jgi:fructokinase
MILCCGEALIDMLPRETAAGEAAFAPYAGGAVFNSAIALGRLGAPVEFFTGLSSDLFGDVLRASLAGSNVGVRYANVSARPTTLAFVKLTNGQARYVFYDEGTAGRMLTEADLPALGANVDAMLFGAISLIPEPCGSTYEALMAREHATRVIMLDPNIRPGFIPDAAAHRARMMRMVAMADIVKLSDEDLAWFGEAGSVEQIAGRWLGLGPKLILLTRGGDGATGYTSRHTVHVPTRRVDVVDTVGAGDTFNAGLLAGLDRAGLLNKASLRNIGEDDLLPALELAAKVAAITVSRAGANPPFANEIAQ